MNPGPCGFVLAVFSTKRHYVEPPTLPKPARAPRRANKAAKGSVPCRKPRWSREPPPSAPPCWNRKGRWEEIQKSSNQRGGGGGAEGGGEGAGKTGRDWDPPPHTPGVSRCRPALPVGSSRSLTSLPQLRPPSPTPRSPPDTIARPLVTRPTSPPCAPGACQPQPVGASCCPGGIAPAQLPPRICVPAGSAPCPETSLRCWKPRSSFLIW